MDQNEEHTIHPETETGHSPESSDQNPQPTIETPSQEPEKHGPIGPVVGIIIIIAIVAFGGLYFWGSSLSESEPRDNDLPMILGDDEGFDELFPPASDSDRMEDIAIDLDNTDMEELSRQMEEDLQMFEEEFNTQ